MNLIIGGKSFIMKHLVSIPIYLFFLLLVFGAETVYGQESEDSLKEKAPNVFLDCYYFDIDHIKQEVSYINYVRDRKDADVHVMVTRERAGNGGLRYSLFMIGQNGYAHIQDTLRFNVGPDASEEVSRKKMLQALQTGLTPYLIKTPLWKYLDITYTRSAEEEVVEDKWNYWIFEVSFDGDMDIEESQQGYEFGGQIEANRVTEENKLELRFDADYEKDVYYVNSHRITSIHRNYDFDGLYIKTLTQHWSAGGFTSLYSSKYRNMAFSYSVSPALEFSVFPYSESTTRQLTILYRPQYEYNDYLDTTLFNKTEENLWKESLAIDYEIIKKWGSIDFSLDFSHYFHDFSKNRVSFGSHVSLNLFKGLSIGFYGGGSLIHDQLSLPKGEATTEEILTRQQQLATNYQYYSGLSISYTFGSMFNNIVNPRF